MTIWPLGPLPTCSGRTFTVADARALGRDPGTFAKAVWRSGEPRPSGARVGDDVVLPVGLQVTVTRHVLTPKRHAWVEIEGVDAAGFFWSRWTSAANLDTTFANVVFEVTPGPFVLAPWDGGATVVDERALLRTAPPALTSLGTTLPLGMHVQILAGDEDAVQVAGLDGTVLGWTRTSNLLPGASDALVGAAFRDPQGTWGRWVRGTPAGVRPTVWIQGAGGAPERLSVELAVAWLSMASAAAADGVVLQVNSGFRTWREQAELRDLYERGAGALAAEPGRSNHQSGIAVDIPVGSTSSRAYRWLARHATAHGFVRTVASEAWHWEHRPREAAAARARDRHTVWG